MIYINNQEKIDKLNSLEDYYCIIDFDHTLTTKNSEPSFRNTSIFFTVESFWMKEQKFSNTIDQ